MFTTQTNKGKGRIKKTNIKKGSNTTGPLNDINTCSL